MITIETTRFSRVVRAFVDEFPSAVIKLDGKIPTEAVAVWCTNANLKKVRSFSLAENGNEILGFHDTPRDMWAANEALPLIEDLAKGKILRISTVPVPVKKQFHWKIWGWTVLRLAAFLIFANWAIQTIWLSASCHDQAFLDWRCQWPYVQAAVVLVALVILIALGYRSIRNKR